MAEFSGKVVIITGASQGLGEHLAVLLANLGAKVVLSSRRVEALETVAEKCRAKGSSGDIQVVKADVAKKEECEHLIAETKRLFTRVDVLVANAGINQRGNVVDIADTEAFRTVFNVNFFGAVDCIKACLPDLIESKGLIVGISSLAGRALVPGSSGYCASKYALEGFLNSLRAELKADNTGVDVLVVDPGEMYHEDGAGRQYVGTENQLMQAPLNRKGRQSSAAVAHKVLASMVKRERYFSASLGIKRWVPLLMNLVPAFVERKAIAFVSSKQYPDGAKPQAG
ncbi:hypothetical protein CYMTET_35342 [Cymbomonas tetramitiformis]|uniref:Ketoreductase domain-containing protein n=1 Tax=Cymbomonas tetramitiformis TaxID=36881 RepID=A0AAE0F9B7_9CHLO|nr:hypothetical protein CYMTET_35342 [Cymbomonas tetramitiformis]|eukprot:gene26540-32578_t